MIATIGKLVPIVLFIVVMVTAFRWDTFTHDFWGEGTISLSAILGQVKNTMLVTLWVFIGVEGAVVLSGRAKNSRDVGKATVLGLILVMSIYILISVLSMGAMTRGELSVLETPSMGHVLEHVVGPWGAVAINIGLVASLVGTLIGWFYLFLKFLMWQEKMAYFRKSLRKQIKSKHRTWHYGFQMVLPKLYLSSFCFRNQHIKLCISLPQHQFYYHIYYQRYSNLN